MEATIIFVLCKFTEFLLATDKEDQPFAEPLSQRGGNEKSDQSEDPGSGFEIVRLGDSAFPAQIESQSGQV